MRNIEIDKARLFLYNLLSLLFVEEYTKNSVEKIVENLEILSEKQTELLSGLHNRLSLLENQNEDDDDDEKEKRQDSEE